MQTACGPCSACWGVTPARKAAGAVPETAFAEHQCISHAHTPRLTCVHTLTHMHVHAHTHMLTHARMHSRAHSRSHVHMLTCAHTLMYACTHSHDHTCIQGSRAVTHICTLMHIHACARSRALTRMHTFTYAHTRARTLTHAHTYLRTHMCAHALTHTRTPIYTHTHTHAHSPAHTPSLCTLKGHSLELFLLHRLLKGAGTGISASPARLCRQTVVGMAPACDYVN